MHTLAITHTPLRYRMAYALLNDKIYVFSGFNKWDEFGVVHDAKSTMIYDIAGDSWQDLGDTDNHMNVLRADACGAAANGKVGFVWERVCVSELPPALSRVTDKASRTFSVISCTAIFNMQHSHAHAGVRIWWLRTQEQL